MCNALASDDERAVLCAFYVESLGRDLSHLSPLTFAAAAPFLALALRDRTAIMSKRKIRRDN
ncbi:MAG: hypothetical protein IT381_12565 [Deltaproteobacteria bacterium]|nr:hypothetical protein [Deltaproteobacteria bacterium]